MNASVIELGYKGQVRGGAGVARQAEPDRCWRIPTNIAPDKRAAIAIMPHSERVGIELGQLVLMPSHELGAQDGFPCVPGAFTVQTPTWPARLHASQAPPHVVLQQTPSMQNPLVHSLPDPHDVPLGAVSAIREMKPMLATSGFAVMKPPPVEGKFVELVWPATMTRPGPVATAVP
jgi:hypothetical protein